MFINDAFAQAAGAAAPESTFMSFVPLILIFFIFYFLIIRPQVKKQKEHQALVGNIKIGNKVITTGGIVGIVKDVDDKVNEIELEISQDVRIRVVKHYILEVVAKKDKKNKKESKK